MADQESKKPKVGVQNWLQKPLPGVNAPVPAGCAGIAITPKMNKELTKLLRTFDNPKAVKAMAPYARSAEELVDDVVAEIAARGFPVGPTVIEKVNTAGLMRMWGRFLFDQAATKDAGSSDASRLADQATRIAAAADANFDRAHELHAKLSAEQASAIVVDPLDKHGLPPEEFAPTEPEAS